MADFSHLQNVNSMLRPNAANEEPAQQEEELIAGFDSIANEEGDGNSDDVFPGFGTADEGLSAEQSSSESTVDLKTENTNLKSTIARLTARVAELEAEQAAYTSAGAINRDRAKSFADRNTHDDAAVLHEKIVAFIPLAEAPGPAAILKGGIESGVQAAFAEAPSNRSARAAMDLFTKEYCTALKVEVKVRLSDAFTATQTITACLVVIRLGNNMFSTIYAAVYKGIKNNEHKMFPRYKGAMKKLLAKSGKRAIQQTGDVVDLIVGAINAKPAFDRAVHELVKRCNASGVRGLKLEISLLTKDASRVGEKVILRPGDACGDASNVTDVVRGMIIVLNMGDVAVVLQCILEMVKEGLIVVNRTKDRFTSPSAGGWRDDLINFTAVEDGVNGGHIGEVQIAHAQLVNARAGLPGHVIYGRVRNSMELVIVAFGKKEVALKILKALEQFAKDVGEDAAVEQAEAKVASFAGACVASEALGEEGVVADAKQIVGLFAIGASVNKKVTLETVEVVGVKMAAIVGSLHVLKGLASRIDDPAVMVEMTKELVDYAARAIKHTVVNGKVPSSKVQADCSTIETNLKAASAHFVPGQSTKSKLKLLKSALAPWQGVPLKDYPALVSAAQVWDVSKAVHNAGGGWFDGTTNESEWAFVKAADSEGKIVKLNFEGAKGLETLPDGICGIEGLKGLTLNGCWSLTSLPSALGKLTALKKLQLLGCDGLTSLPSSIGQLASLKELNLSYCNGLTSLPSTLGQLAALETLHIKFCKEALKSDPVVAVLKGRGVVIKTA